MRSYRTKPYKLSHKHEEMLPKQRAISFLRLESTKEIKTCLGYKGIPTILTHVCLKNYSWGDITGRIWLHQLMLQEKSHASGTA
jgi:hypothetical protein